jgi:hypothetical protein
MTLRAKTVGTALARVVVLVPISLFSLMRLTSGGTVEEPIRTMDAAGTWASNSWGRTLVAVAQGCPVGTAWGTNVVNHSGFLNAFLWDPAADFDGDGIADENDGDDDGDGLTDLNELAGLDFAPPTETDSMSPDTDGDGMTDGAEASAGTNPRDVASLFRILGVQAGSGGVVVTWQSRAGYRYDLLTGSSVVGLGTNPVVAGSVTATGGVAPWWEAVSELTNSPGGGTNYYRVRVATGN